MSTKSDPFSSLRSHEFRSFIGVRFFTTFAWQMQFTALAWTVAVMCKPVYGLSKTALIVGGLGLCEFLPVVLLALPVGHQVEKLEKRRVLLSGISVALFGSLMIALLSASAVQPHLSQLTLLDCFFALVALGGVARAYLAPTFFSLIGGIVPKGQQTNSATWTASAFLAAQVSGPIFGGLFLNLWGEFAVQMCVGSLLLVALFLGTRLNQHQPVAHVENDVLNEEKGLTKLLTGLRFVWRNPYMRGASVLDLLAVLFGDAVPLLPLYVPEILNGSASDFGILRAMPGIGSCLMMMTLAKFPPRKNAGRILLVVVFAYGLGMLGFGLSHSFTLTLIILLACGALDGVSVIIRQSIMQLHTPAHMRGRIGSVNSIFISSSNELGTFVSGSMAAILGLAPAILTGGVFILVLTGWTALFNPTLRKMELEEQK